jgi:predicted Zn-dependent protease
MAAPDAPERFPKVVAALPPASAGWYFGQARQDRGSGTAANTAAVTPKAASAKTYSPMQVSANLVAEAVRLDQQGHLEDAKALLGRALVANPLDMQARRMLVRLQLDTGRVEEAVALMVEGRRLHPEQPDFTLTLARLKAETGDSAGAIQLLEEGHFARDEPQYHALLARSYAPAHDEAVQHYLMALRNDPQRWLVGVALRWRTGNNRTAEAYRRAEGPSKRAPRWPRS